MTLVALGAVVAALYMVPRLRLPSLTMLFQSAGYLLALRLFATYWVPGSVRADERAGGCRGNAEQAACLP